jgi:hypothetical protein
MTAAIYDNVLGWPRRCRRQHKLPADTRRRLTISALFLYSEAEYDWPDSFRPQASSCGCLLVLSCAVALLAAAGLLTVSVKTGEFAIAVAGLACLGLAYFSARLDVKLVKRLQAFWDSEQAKLGDHVVWPFLRLEDFGEARRYPPLLCGS